jgi:hypothetical protein
MVNSRLDCTIFDVLDKTYEWLLMVAMLLSIFGVKQENRRTDTMIIFYLRQTT